MGIPVASRRSVASSPEFPAEPSSPLHESASHNRLAGDPLVSRLWEMSGHLYRGALTGAMFSGVFGLAWTEWGASGISGAESTAIRVVGIVLGPDHLVLVRSPAALRWREWIGVYVLVAELSTHSDRGGGRARRRGCDPRSDRTPRIRHRLVRHRGRNTFSGVRRDSSFAGFYWLGTALIAAGIAGTIVGLAGGGLGGIEATTGLIAAASLFAAGGSTLISARASSHV